MSWTNNCIQCVHCDGMNHAHVGSGEQEFGCINDKRQFIEYVGSGSNAQNCNRFTMKEFFKKQKEKSSCQM